MQGFTGEPEGRGRGGFPTFGTGRFTSKRFDSSGAYMQPWVFSTRSFRCCTFLQMALLVVHIQHQLGGRWIIAVSCDGAVHHVIFIVDLQVACLVPPFQQTPEDQHHDAVADHEHILSTVIPRERPQESMDSESNIGSAFTTRTWRDFKAACLVHAPIDTAPP